MKELPIQIAAFIRISVLIIGVKLNTLFGFGFQKGRLRGTTPELCDEFEL
jgi:hypothetical protein